MTINTSRKGYTAPGTKHERVVRKGVGGRPLPAKQEGRTWQGIVAPGPAPRTGLSPAQKRAAALFADVPVQTQAVTPPADVAAPQASQPSRRARRPAMRAAAKAERRARRGGAGEQRAAA